jgi:hypothetical protein
VLSGWTGRGQFVCGADELGLAAQRRSGCGRKNGKQSPVGHQTPGLALLRWWCWPRILVSGWMVAPTVDPDPSRSGHEHDIGGYVPRASAALGRSIGIGDGPPFGYDALPAERIPGHSTIGRDRTPNRQKTVVGNVHK